MLGYIMIQNRRLCLQGKNWACQDKDPFNTKFHTLQYITTDRASNGLSHNATQLHMNFDMTS